MNLEEILYIVVPVVSFVLGIIAKKSKYISDNLIPIQNLLVGLIASVIYYLFTKDINLVITGLGLFAGGTYDIFHNINKILEERSLK